MTIPPELETKIDEVIAHYPVSKRSASMPLLHLIQEHFGCISDDAITWVARKLALQPINILELVTFYPMFRRVMAGEYHIRVCRTLSCAMGGSYELMNAMCKAAGIERPTHGNQHGGILKSADGKFSIEFVECLASCGTAPVCMVNDDFYEGVAPESAGSVLEPYILGKTK